MFLISGVSNMDMMTNKIQRHRRVKLMFFIFLWHLRTDIYIQAPKNLYIYFFNSCDFILKGIFIFLFFILFFKAAVIDR